jgi:hypothetical protein
LRLVVVAVAEAVAAEVSPAVGRPLAVLFAATRCSVVSVEKIVATFLIIAAAGKKIVVIGVATCRIVVASARMIFRTLARKGVKTGRTTEMMCEMIVATGTMIAIAITEGLA